VDDGRNDTAHTLPWMRTGTEHVFALVAKLSDAELAEPSALPEWSRAHVVAHLARNAEALIRLVTWARQRGVIVASDECYLDLGWDVTPPSILDDAVCGGSHAGLLAAEAVR